VTSPGSSFGPAVQLEPDPTLPAGERLAWAAKRVGRREGAIGPPTLLRPRPEQERVLVDFDRFLIDSASRTPPGGSGRIVLPPRTGKTVIAGHILARTGLLAAFVVPTRVLAEQTARMLSDQLPGVPVGLWYGEERRVVPHGINVITYAMLQRAHELGQLGPGLARAALVFLDEAHHTMTTGRVALVREAFDREALRIALTATPDYDHQRALCRFFPELIHEITVEEALAMGLLAPARIWVAEVDVAGSEVRLLAGDFDEGELGQVMSEAPFLRAAELFRYHAENAAMPAIIACASRRQAQQLVAFLDARLPAGHPAPALVLGTTPRDERERILHAFELGELDTLVQVGVLVEGWNSPRCKLLVDLAPSLSRVRATQKFFRVLTRNGSEEARIYVVLPTDLPALPVLPTELLGRSLRDYACGDLIGEDPSGPGRVAQPISGPPLIDSVHLRQRILLEARLERPLLEPGDTEGVRRVLLSHPDFEPRSPGSLRRFCQLFFEHEFFVGRGEFLLRWLGVPPTFAAYVEFLARVFPDTPGPGLLWLERERERHDFVPVSEDLDFLRRVLLEPGPGSSPRSRDEGFALGWGAVSGRAGWGERDADQGRNPEEILLRNEQLAIITHCLGGLATRSRRVLALTYGLCGMPPLSSGLVAEIEDANPKLISLIVNSATRRLSEILKPSVLGSADNRRSPRLPPFRRGLPQPRLWKSGRHERSQTQTDGPESDGRTFYVTRPWRALSPPLEWSSLRSRLRRVLEELRLPNVWLDGAPQVGRSALDGTEYDELLWLDGEWNLRVLAVHGWRLSPDGHEQHRPLVFACLGWERESHRTSFRVELCLVGIGGRFQGLSIEGDHGGRLASAWRATDDER
jgi:superfamily II DNA or RNA helicase